MFKYMILNIIMNFRRKVFKKVKNSYFYYLICKLFPSKFYIKVKFRLLLGYKLDLDNPKTYNEKLQRKKLYDKNPIYTICSDKFKVRDYVKNKIWEKYLIPLLFHTKNPQNINFNNLKGPFIIKTNHGSGQNIIVKNVNTLNKNKIIKTLTKWLKINFYEIGKERQYKNIKPRIIIEKLLIDKNWNIAKDYKFHCSQGKIWIIKIDIDKYNNHKKIYLNSEWKPLNTINKSPIEIDYKPKNSKLMEKIVNKLSKDFDYVRVDLYSTKWNIFFGELTFTPWSWFDKIIDKNMDKILGDMIHISSFSKKYR